jgi:hypothetical protein
MHVNQYLISFWITVTGVFTCLNLNHRYSVLPASSVLYLCSNSSTKQKSTISPMSVTQVIDTVDLNESASDDGFGPGNVSDPIADEHSNQDDSWLETGDTIPGQEDQVNGENNPSLSFEQFSEILADDEEIHQHNTSMSSNHWSVVPSFLGDVPVDRLSGTHLVESSSNDLANWWSDLSSHSIRKLEYHQTAAYLSSPFNHPVTSTFDEWFGRTIPRVQDFHVSEAVFPTALPATVSNPTRKRTGVVTNLVYDTAVWRNIAQRAGNSNWSEHKDASRTAALGKWRGLIQIAPQCSSFGRSLLQDVLHLKTDEQLTRSLEDALSSRSTKTLHKRADYVIKYVSWCSFKGVDPFPIQENQVYSFLYDCNWKSPSFASTFRESLNFIGGVLGFDNAMTTAESPRISGMCARTKMTTLKRPQAKVLTVDQVIKLEKLVSEAIDPIDRVLAGHMLFVLYARCRWSDVQAIEELVVDCIETGHGYIEAKTTYVKTANTTEKKRMFLPITSITDGLYDPHWSSKWLLERSNAGLNDPAPGIPFLPTIAPNGRFSSLPMSPSTGSQCLRDLLLLAGCNKEQVRGISSHSLKSTCLSWASKAGMSRELRQVLGYHVVQGSKTALHYSRDEQAEPLRQMSNILMKIRLHLFNPDCTRSGYFKEDTFLLPKPKVLPSPKTAVDCSNDANVVDSALTSESSSTDSDSSSSAKWSDEERAFACNRDLENQAKRRRGAELSDVSQYAVHRRWRTLHCVRREDSLLLTSNTTWCGRQVTASYKLFHSLPSVECSNCLVCFGDKAVAN